MKSSLALSLAVIAVYSSASFAASHTQAQQIDSLKDEIAALQKKVDHLESTQSKGKGGNSHFNVGTGASFGLDTAYDGSDLLVNTSKIHKDWTILKENQRMDKINGPVGENGPRIQFGGQVSADVASSSLNKTSVSEALGELDLSAQINEWVTGYTNASASTADGKLTMDQAFVTVGNLDKAPVFVSAGKMYIPTGNYSSNMLEHSLPRKLVRGATPSVVGTYVADNGFYTSVFGYNGNTQKTKSTKLDQYGLNVGYNHSINKDLSFKTSASYMSNMAYGSSSFSNALGTGGKLHHYVPAVDVNGSITYRDFTFLHEYITATKGFSRADLSQGAHGARPSASNYELAYNFPLFGKTATAAVGYGETKDALGLGLPQKQIGTSLAVPVAKNTVFTVSYTQARNYKGGSASSSKGGSVSGNGARDNILGAEIDVYF